MIGLYNLKTRRVDNFSNRDAEAALKLGSHTILQGQTVPMMSQTGDIYEVQGQEIFGALNEGWTLAEPMDFEGAKFREEEGVKGEVKAGLAGAARGATLGLSDLFATAVLGVNPDDIKKYKEFYPESSFVSEVAGALAPAILTPTAASGLTAKVISKMPAGYLARSARSLESLVANNLRTIIPAAETSTLAKTIVSATSIGFGSAVESAFYGGGRLVSESAMGDAQFNAENLAAYAGQDFLIGGAFGTAVPALFGITKALAKQATDKAIKLGARFLPEGAIDKGIQDFLGVPADLVDKFFKDPEAVNRALSRDEIANQIVENYKVIESKVKANEVDRLAVKESTEEMKVRLREAQIELREAKSGLEKSKKLNQKITDSNLKDLERVNIQTEKAVNEEISKIKDKLKKEGPPDELVERIFKTKDSFGKELSQLSSESYQILEEAGEDIANLKTASVAESVAQYIEDQKFNGQIILGDKIRVATINKYLGEMASLGDELRPKQVKAFLQKLDAVTEDLYKAKEAGKSSQPYHALRAFREIIDSHLKDYAPYREKMAEIAEKTKFLRGEFEPRFKDIASVRYALYNSPNPKYKDSLERIYKLGDYTGNDFRGPIGEYAERVLLGQAKDSSDTIAKLYNLEPGSDEYNRIRSQFENIVLEKNIDLVPLRENLTEKLNTVGAFRERLASGQSRLKEIGDEIRAGKEAMKTYGGFNTKYQAIRRVQSLSSKKSDEIRAALGKISELTNEDFVGMIEDLRLAEAFNKSFLRGSRNVNLWAIIGVGTGATMGVLPAMIGAGLGSVVGAYIDHFGPSVAKYILTKIAQSRGLLSQAKISQAIASGVEESAEKIYLEGAAKTYAQIEKAVQKTSQKIDNATRTFFRGTNIAVALNAPIGDREDRRKTYLDYKKKMDKMLGNRQTYFDDFSSETTFLQPFASNTLAAYQATWLKATEFLESKFPRSDNELIDFIPSTTEMDKFIRYYNYVQNPLTVIDEFKKGYVSSQGIEVLKTIYPTIYQAFLEGLYGNFEKSDKLTSSQRSQLTLAFDLPFSVASLPANLDYLQRDLPEQNAEEGQNPGRGVDNLKQTGLDDITLGERMTSETNRIINRRQKT